MPSVKFLLKMTQNIQFHLNKEELLLVCNKLGVLPNELGKSMKSLVLGNTVTSNYPVKFKQELVEEWKKENLKAPQDKVKDLTEDELRKVLGISKNGKNEKNKIRQHGLYMKNNVEDALMNFSAHWNGDVYKLLEIRDEVMDFAYKEFVVRELKRRGFKAE